MYIRVYDLVVFDWFNLPAECICSFFIKTLRKKRLIFNFSFYNAINFLFGILCTRQSFRSAFFNLSILRHNAFVRNY